MHPREITTDILICGAGLAGAAVALALAHRLPGHVRIAVVDRMPLAQIAERADLRATALSLGSVHMLDHLGLWRGPTASMADHAAPMRRIELTDSAKSDRVRPTLLGWDNVVDDGIDGGSDDAGDGANGSPTRAAAHVVQNTYILQALAGGLRNVVDVDDATGSAGQAARLEVLAPGRIKAARFSGARAEVTVDHGAAGTSTVQAQLVIAADGRQSAVRELARIPVVRKDYDQAGIVATLDLARDHGNVATQHFTGSGPFVLLPLPGRQASIVWTQTTAETKRAMALDGPGFEEALNAMVTGRLGPVRLASERQSWPLKLELARRLTGPRLALMAETARVVHPIAGQGLNLAMRDAAALADVLGDAAAAGQDLGSAVVLEAYARWRQFDATLSARAFDAVNAIFRIDAGPVRMVRQAGMGLLNRFDGAKRLLAREAAGVIGERASLMQPPQHRHADR